MSVKECLAHVGAMVHPDMMEYITDTALRHSRYIFTRRQGKHQIGHCTQCKHEFETQGLRHNATAICPSCGSECTVKASGLKRGRMLDHALITHWRKSATDPEMLVAVSAYVYRDYRTDYLGVETVVKPESICVFRVKDGGIMFRKTGYWDAKGKYVPTWAQANTVRCYFYKEQYSGITAHYSRDTLAAAIAGTPFQYSTWERYDHGDMAMFFDLYARYPSIEYLTKLGFSNLVSSKLYGGPTYGAINWGGNNPLTVLRLTKQDLRTVIDSGIQVTFPMLKLLQIGRRDGSNFSLGEVATIAHTYRYQLNILLKMHKYARMRRIINYMNRQSEDQGCGMARNPYRTPESALQAWRDYLADCTRLEMDITSESVLFPKSLHFSHQHTGARRRALEEQLREQKMTALRERQDRGIQRRAKLLAKMGFEQGELFLRPIASYAELVAEGKKLKHCVASYAEQYATGKTTILALRRASEPDQPFYTVEVFKGRVTQCYGMRDCLPTPEVHAFMDAFVHARLMGLHGEAEVAN